MPRKTRVVKFQVNFRASTVRLEPVSRCFWDLMTMNTQPFKLKHHQHPQRYLLASVLLTCLTLVACQPSLLVSPASDEEALPTPRFRVQDPSRPGERPLYNTIQVLAANGHVLWHLRAEPFGDSSSVEEFTYGESPAGFATVVAALPLAIGGRYTVVVSGIAYGTFRFRVDGVGKLQKQ